MKLSIIVPIYNVEPYLHRCIDSILAQSFRDYELILVDDGSPDACPAICDEYAQKDNRICVIHKPNGGLSDARNAGLDIAQGEFVGFVDSDDYICVDMYQQLIALAEQYDADIVACGQTQVDQDGIIVEKWPILSEDKVYHRKDFIDNFFPDVRTVIMPSACSKLYKRSLFQTIRYPKGKLYEDCFVQLSLLNQCSTIVVSKNHFYNYFYNRSTSIMNQSYTKKCFHLMEFSYNQWMFFVDKDLPAQQGYALLAYLNRYLLNFFAVHLSHKDLKKDFRFYKRQFRTLLGRIITSVQICKLKKLAAIMTLVSKRYAFRICKNYFPECLPEFLQMK